MEIRRFIQDDWASVKEIYRLGILTGNATFETSVPEYEVFAGKFCDGLLWVLVLDQVIVGWAGLQAVSARKVYEGVMEITLYIHPDFQGRRLATALINYLIEKSEEVGVWTLYASILEENIPSRKLHLSAGFREIGYREKIARLAEKWRNTVLYERRSTVVGK